MSKICIFVVLMLFSSVLSMASESINNLLAEIESKNDLSLKTKQENSGVSYIYTRHDLDSMQARYLKDIFKSTTIGYGKSRYNIVDPLGIGNTPFLSSTIRIFIDNQEVTSALYGSGLVMLGDMALDFVDHIEIYTLTPSFEFTTEATLTIIKLYSKLASRDVGGKIDLSTGSYGSNFESFQYADKLDDFAYFAYFSKDNDNLEKYSLDGESELNRDADKYNFFASIYDDKQKLLIDVLKVDKGGFLGPSLDGTPDDSEIDIEAFHIGYERDFDGGTYFSFIVDRIDNDSYFKDDPLTYVNNVPIYTFKVKSSSMVYTAKLKHKIETDNDKFITGLKYRYKKFKYRELKFNGIELPRYGHDRQIVSTVFIENDYSIMPNSIVTVGASLSHIANNGNAENQDTLLVRIGYTFLQGHWIFKTFGFRMEKATDPYLINSIYIAPGTSLKTQKMDLFLEDIKYKINKHLFEFIAGYFISKDTILPDLDGYIDNYKNKVVDTLISLKWVYKYAPLNSLHCSFEVNAFNDLPGCGSVNYYRGVVRNIHRWKKFNLYQELIYARDSHVNKNYFDLSLGAKYQLRDDLTVSIKGENILNKGEEQHYTIIDMSTFTPTDSLAVPTVDRKITLNLEWYF